MKSFPPEADLGPAASLSAALIAAAVRAGEPCSGIWIRCPDVQLAVSWCSRLRRLIPGVPWIQAHSSAPLERFEDQLDLAASLRDGRKVMQPGIVGRSEGGVLVVHAAQSLRPELVQRLVSAMRAHRLRVIAVDTSTKDEPAPPAALVMELPLVLDLHSEGFQWRDPDVGDSSEADALEEVFDLAPGVPPVCDAIWLETLVSAADALGLQEAPYAWGCLQVARLLARCEGAKAIDQAHIEQAIGLGMLPRARTLPAPQPQSQAETPSTRSDPAPGTTEPRSSSSESLQNEVDAADPAQIQAMAEQVIEAAMARLPEAVLTSLRAPRQRARRTTSAGGQGRRARSVHHGRPLGEVAGVPRGGAKLHVLATLKAAAPWQSMRKRLYPARAHRPLLIQTQDLRLHRFDQGTPTVTLFVVDASGSAALHRLNEAKGAVELMLADCYVRRDAVALLAFGGHNTQVVLAPTRSLVAAKRKLADLPAGGGTPLARALLLADQEVQRIQRSGQTPIVVLLTDGRANLALDGRADRHQASADALKCAATLRARDIQSVVIDTSAHPSARALELSQTLGARYLALPYADARQMHRGLKAAVG
jgi:magnesium chelatase subunit D